MKIAAFDSGVGGLTALAPLLRAHNGLRVTYFGDLANLPYGTKSPQRVRELTGRNLEWLLGLAGADADPASREPFALGVIACNTASAQAMELGRDLGRKLLVPVVGVLEPGCRAALLRAQSRIVIIATASTVASQAYVKTLEALGCALPIVQQACPLFVPLVEEGLHQSPAAEWTARHYLEGVLRPGDTVILGCTHYPFLLPLLQKLYPQQQWIDAGASLSEDREVTDLLARQLRPGASVSQLHLKFSDRGFSESRVQGMLSELGLSGIATSFELVSPVV